MLAISHFFYQKRKKERKKKDYDLPLTKYLLKNISQTTNGALPEVWGPGDLGRRASFQGSGEKGPFIFMDMGSKQKSSGGFREQGSEGNHFTNLGSLGKR